MSQHNYPIPVPGQFICIYDHWSRKRYYFGDPMKIPVTMYHLSRVPFHHKEEIEEAGGMFARESKEEIEHTLQGRLDPSISFGRSDIWFPKYPQIVIQTNQRSCYVWGLIKSAGTGDIFRVKILEMDVGEWGLKDGRPFFVTHEKVFPHWRGHGPWLFLEMCFPNLPQEV